MSHIKALALFIFLAIGVFPALGQNSPTEVQDRLTLDFGAAHNFAGLGTQFWIHPPHQKEQDEFMKALHLRYVRVACQWHVPLEALRGHPSLSVEEIADLIEKYDTSTGFDQSVLNLKDEMAALGTEMHFVFFMAPSCWLHDTGNHKDWVVNPEYFQNFANWTVAQLLYAKDYGLVPTHIEISNEPEGTWNGKFTPAQYDAYLAIVRKTLDAHGLQEIKIAGPGVSMGSKATAPYLAAVEQNGHGNLLDIMSVHCYDGTLTTRDFPDFAIFKPLRARLAPATPLFVTEYNNRSHFWGSSPYQTLPGKRGPKNGGDTADFAISSVGDGLKIIADGANAIFVWEASDQAWGASSYGLIDLAGKTRPVGLAMQTAFQGIPWDVPAVGAVGANGASEGLVAVAFQTPDGIRLDIDNMSAQTHALKIDMKGLGQMPNAIAHVALFDSQGSTDASANHPTLENSVLTDEIPPRTLVVITLPYHAQEPLPADNLLFDFGRAHPFAGLGAHVWMNPTRQEARDAAYRDLHMRFLRASVYPKIPDSQFKEHGSVEELLDLTKANDNPALHAHEIAFQQEVSSLGAELHLVSWEMPEPWRSDSNDHKIRRAKSEHIADYANLVVARLLYAKELGFTPSYIELTNEPDGAWNTQYTPEQYDALLATCRAVMDQYHLQDVKIEGPGIGLGSGPDAVAKFLDVIRQNGHGNLLGLVSAHDYDTTLTATKWPRLENILPAIAAFDRPLELYYTEFGNSAHYWGQPPYNGGVKSRSAQNGVDTPDFGVSSGGDALRLMAEGANAAFIWELADEAWGNGSRGVIDIEGHHKPLYEGLRIIFAGLPWDVAVVGGSRDDSELVTLACRTPDGIRFYAANLSTAPRSFTARFKNEGSEPARIDEIKTYDAQGSTDASANHPTLENGVLTDEIPPRTLLSITLKSAP